MSDDRTTCDECGGGLNFALGGALYCRACAQGEALPAWTREEREDGVVGYYLKQGPLVCAIWGAIPHAPRARQRWGWAVYVSGGGTMLEIASERPAPDNLDALATSPVAAHARLVKAYDAWRAGLPALPLLRTTP